MAFTQMVVVVHLQIHIYISEEIFSIKKKRRTIMVHAVETMPAGHAASG